MIEPSISLEKRKNVIVATCPALHVEFRGKDEAGAIAGCRQRCFERLEQWRQSLEAVPIDEVTDSPEFKHHEDEAEYEEDPDEDEEELPEPDYRKIPQAPEFVIHKSGRIKNLKTKEAVRSYYQKIGRTVYRMIDLPLYDETRRHSEIKPFSIRSLLMQAFGYEAAEEFAA